MKRFIAILLLHIILMSAGQPVLALHYCGDHLLSFTLLHTGGTSDSCCDMEADDKKQIHPVEDYTFGMHSATCTLEEKSETCCNTQLLTPGTDDYQNKIEQPVSRFASTSYEGIAALLIPLFKLSESETYTIHSLHDFPPGGLFLQDVRLLTFICIYRI